MEFLPVFVNGEPFRSRYAGSIGFGGSDDNFVVIYGAYEGQAYYVHGGKADNISHLFGIRVMQGGFKPAVLKGDDWYVYSLTEGTPKLVKLFQNGGDSIVGGIDLTRSLFQSGVKSALFRLSGNRSLLADVRGPGAAAGSWEFVDKGFDKSAVREIVSVNINNYPAEGVEAVIAKLSALGGGGSAELFLKNDDGAWNRAEAGVKITFKNKNGRQLLWRARFIPDNNPYTTPFLDTIQLKYLVRFL